MRSGIRIDREAPSDSGTSDRFAAHRHTRLWEGTPSGRRLGAALLERKRSLCGRPSWPRVWRFNDRGAQRLRGERGGTGGDEEEENRGDMRMFPHRKEGKDSPPRNDGAGRGRTRAEPSLSQERTEEAGARKTRRHTWPGWGFILERRGEAFGSRGIPMEMDACHGLLREERSGQQERDKEGTGKSPSHHRDPFVRNRSVFPIERPGEDQPLFASILWNSRDERFYPFSFHLTTMIPSLECPG